MLARRGFEDLVGSPAAGSSRVLPVFPQLIMPLRAALKSPSHDVIQAGLRAVELLVQSCPEGGAALLPYYRQLLPPLSKWVPGQATCSRGEVGRSRGMCVAHRHQGH